MKTKTLCLIAVFVLVSLQSTAALSIEGIAKLPDTMLVFRNDDGSLPDQSRRAVRALKKTATINGFVELWLYMDKDALFSDPDDVSEKQFGRACVKILRRLVNAGYVQHPTRGPTNYGPICYVRAAHGAVGQLTSDARFEQILGATHAH